MFVQLNMQGMSIPVLAEGNTEENIYAVWLAHHRLNSEVYTNTLRFVPVFAVTGSTIYQVYLGTEKVIGDFVVAYNTIWQPAGNAEPLGTPCDVIASLGYFGYCVWRVGTQYMGDLVGQDMQPVPGSTLWQYADSEDEARHKLTDKARRMAGKG